MKPLVSILIPAYNAEKWIGETILSALAQTYPRKEIIVVDDGSTDRTIDIVDRFSPAGVLIIRQPNQGAAAARNKAFSISHGEYIQWLDADDLLAPDKIAKQMQVAQSDPNPRVLLSAPWGKLLYRTERARFTPSQLWCDLTPVEFVIRKMEHKVGMPLMAWLVSRELTAAAGPWDVGLCFDDDGEYFCRVQFASVGIRFVHDANSYYRSVGSSSVSFIGRSNAKLNAQWRAMQLHIGYLRSVDDSPRARNACLTYLQNYVVDVYPARLDIFEQMALLAKSLGGELGPPRLSWKYSWLKRFGGWDLAQRAQLFCPGIKWSALRFWDKTMHTMKNGIARSLNRA